MTKAAVLTTPRPSRSRTNGTQETPLTVTQEDPPQSTAAQQDGARVAEALRTQETFTRGQVAWLMHTWYQLGYQHRDEEDLGYWAGYNARVAEENTAQPAPKVFTLGKWYDQAGERAKTDAVARLPRPGDFRGHSAARRQAAA